MGKHYDFIFAGGGAAGLSLAYHIAQSALRNTSMLVIDRQVKNHNDHTWCSWLRGEAPFDSIAYRTWHHLAFHSAREELLFTLKPYRYRMLRSIDFYRFTREALAAQGVDFMLGDVERIVDGPTQAEVWANELAFSADWVFDSRYDPALYPPPHATGRHDLLQHFLGWEIEVAEPSFDPHVPLLFDFRTPQQGAMRFVYILPYSVRRALVEYTLFSAQVLPLAEYEAALRTYIRDVLHVSNYHILDEERGVIPMTDALFCRRAGQRVLNTGTRGGRVKAATGYAFQRIQQDNAAIVRSLLAHGHPFDIHVPPQRYRTFDTMLLHILERRGHLGRRIFTDLFNNNPIQRLFRFLDEEGTLWENIHLMLSVPPGPFIKAWIATRTKQDRKKRRAKSV